LYSVLQRLTERVMEVETEMNVETSIPQIGQPIFQGSESGDSKHD